MTKNPSPPSAPDRMCARRLEDDTETDSELEDDPQLEECAGQVLSPRDDTMEGKEKLE